ncbi:Ubiquitin-conjugating enzyme E2 T [Mortierella sp. NVP85]|nr:Ubiquitin-conjugating enzyme E2 T [Mortierella sp. NVP85]
MAALEKRILIRMRKEIKNLETSPPLGIVCFPLNDSIVHLQAEFTGPPDTPYSGGTFKMEIHIPEKYPFEPPRCQFLTKVYHPNIDDQGRICLDILKGPPKGSWNPAISIATMLLSLRVLLANPNPDDPLLVDIGQPSDGSRTCQRTEELEPTATGVAMASGNVRTSTSTSTFTSAPCSAARELPRPQDMSQSSMLSHDTPIDSKDKKSLTRPALKKPNLKATRTKTAGDHIIDSSLHPGTTPTTDRLAESQQGSVEEPLKDTLGVLVIEADVKKRRVHPVERDSNPIPIVDTGAKRDTSCAILEDIFDTEEKQVHSMQEKNLSPAPIVDTGAMQNSLCIILDDTSVTEEKQVRPMKAKGSKPSMIAVTAQDDPFTVMEDTTTTTTTTTTTMETTAVSARKRDFEPHISTSASSPVEPPKLKKARSNKDTPTMRIPNNMSLEGTGSITENLVKSSKHSEVVYPGRRKSLPQPYTPGEAPQAMLQPVTTCTTTLTDPTTHNTASQSAPAARGSPTKRRSSLKFKQGPLQPIELDAQDNGIEVPNVKTADIMPLDKGKGKAVEGTGSLKGRTMTDENAYTSTMAHSNSSPSPTGKSPILISHSQTQPLTVAQKRNLLKKRRPGMS